jgi:DNA-binding CsgD family transcriptional regulator
MLTNISGEGVQANSSLVFTEREEEFLGYVTTELNYNEIADKMCCSPRTIENYRNSLCEKLGVKTRVGLAVYAMENKIGR